MTGPIVLLLVAAFDLLVGLVIGFAIAQIQNKNKKEQQQNEAEHLLNLAKEEAQNLDLQAKDKALQLRQAAEVEITRRRTELSREEDRLQKRREELDIRLDRLEKREQMLNKRQSFHR